MTFNWIIVFVAAVPFVFAARIQLLDITPEEAQKLITQQSLDLRYAKKLGEGSASGRSYNGKIIDSGDYTEEIYEANQFHGQDGLGRSIFGYTDNQQSRLEARNVNGEVRGQYQYIDPWGNDIQVQYWSDLLGFHQTDNRPKFELQPVTETPEVKKARENHERLWKEAARLNGVDPDANDLYNKNAERLESEQYDDDQELEGQVSNQHQSLARYPVLPYSKHITPDTAKTYGKVVDDSVIVDVLTQNDEGRSRVARQGQIEAEQDIKEPRGFFYSFDYQVPFIVDHAAGRSQPEAQASEHRFVIHPQEEFIETETQHPKVSENIRDGYVPEEEIHDIQTSPKQNFEEQQHRYDVRFQENVESETEKIEIEAQHPRVSENIRDGIFPPEEIHDVQSNPRQKISRGRGSIKFSNKKN